jgi:hypothetical protein
MRFRGLTSDGDWTFGRGKQDYVADNDAVLLNVNTRLKQFYSECFFAPGDGVPWFNLLGQKDQMPILTTLRSKILESYGVVSVHDISIAVDVDRKAVVTYVIDTIYSTGVVGVLEV